MMHSSNDVNESSVVAYQNAAQNNMDMANYYADPLGNSSAVGIPGNIESPNIIGDYTQVVSFKIFTIVSRKKFRTFVWLYDRCISNSSGNKAEICK